MNRILLTGSVMYPPMVQSMPDGRPVVNVKVRSQFRIGQADRFEVFQLSFLDMVDVILPDVEVGRKITCTGKLSTKSKGDRLYLNVLVDNWEWHDLPNKNPSHLDFEQEIERWY